MARTRVRHMLGRQLFLRLPFDDVGDAAERDAGGLLVCALPARAYRLA